MMIIRNRKTNHRFPLATVVVVVLMSAIMCTGVLAGPVLAAVSDFRYRVPIILNDSAALYNMVELTDEVVGETQSGLPDMRILSGGEEIPYAIITEQDYIATTRVVHAQIINQGRDPQGNLQFEALLPSQQLVRQLIVISSDKNFIRRVKVEGSSDQRNWLVLTEDSTIFDLTEEQKTRHLEINLAPTDFLFLRITIFNEGKGTFHFEGLQVSAQNQREAALQPKERAYNTTNQGIHDQVQDYTFDLLQPHLITSELEIVTDAVNFDRAVQVYASEDNEMWNPVANGEIFVYQLDRLAARQLVLKFKTNLRFLKFRIYNYDNPPLTISSIKIRGTNPMLIFPAEPKREMALFWGNSEVRAPVYDIEKFKGSIDFSKTPRASLEAAAENQDYKSKETQTLASENYWLFRVILVIVVTALLLLIIRSIRKISSE